jgi:hypothetical protein
VYAFNYVSLGKAVKKKEKEEKKKRKCQSIAIASSG